MGTRSSRFQDEVVEPSFDRDGINKDSCRRVRSKRPTSLAVDFSASFDQYSETNHSRSEEGSDSDQGQQASSDQSPADRSLSLPDQTNPSDETSNKSKHINDKSPGGDSQQDQLSRGETGRVPQRTFSERLPAGRHSSERSNSARIVRSRTTHPRPISEAWIGLYRVNNRHATIRCPFCSKPFPGGRIEDHLLNCLTSPPLPYNTDTLGKDIGECAICLEDMLQGETIARLACLCVYHKSCIDSWSKVKACCPEHPFD